MKAHRDAEVRPTVHASRARSGRHFRPVNARDLDLTAAGDGERLRRMFLGGSAPT